jgi:hypothetical protein
MFVPTLVATTAILGLCFKLKIHKNTSTTFTFSIGTLSLVGLTGYNRYVTSLKCFEQLPPLPDSSLEEERMEIIRDSFLVDYKLFVKNVEREYKDSKLGDEFKFKNFN